MTGKFLPTLVFIAILAVSVLFVFSIFNPTENDRVVQDRATINLLQREVSSSSSASPKCFKPASQYYQGDPRAIYDSKGEMNFGGFLCLRR